MRRTFLLPAVLVCLLLAGGEAAVGDTYYVDFSNGLDPGYWTTENWPGGGSSPYTFTTTTAGELVSKDAGSNYGAYGKLHFTLQVLGDFDARVFFSDASLERSGLGSPGNMIELYTLIDSNVLTAVRSDFSTSGSDYHMFTTYPSNSQYGHISTADTAGGLRVTRTGDTVSGYYLDHDGVTWDLIAPSQTFLTGPAEISLHLGNVGTPDAVSVIWESFSVTADNIMVPEPSTLVLLAVSLLSLAFVGRRRRKR